MIKLASYEDCTGCGACSFACNKSAITMRPNSIGVVFPCIDENKCIECGRCQKLCPAIHEVELNKPKKAFAAWHNTTSERVSSASGAIASAAYHFAIEKGWEIAGAAQNDDFSVDVIVSDNCKDISRFKNSKYVFSSIEKLLPRVEKNIKDGKKTLVIALPCQIAALKKCFPNNKDLLVLADVVCHGSTPHSYLSQHIKNVEAQTNKKAKTMFFRDPSFDTYTYTFSLYDESGNRFYAKRTKDGDTYQIAYHRMISYRENCFHCHYARPERVGDFTLCDYSGLGKVQPFEYNRINCSCILVNTVTGKSFIETLIREKIISAFERPIEEPIKGNRQLRLPCKKSRERNDFEIYINKYKGDFEKTMHKVISNYEKRRIFRFIQKLPSHSILTFRRLAIKIKRRIV